MRAFALLCCALALSASPSGAQSQISLYDASVRALKNTQLNYPGSAPFHVKISVTDSHPEMTTRHATIEMWWASPTKYRRVILSPEFSQTRVVNGDTVAEDDKDDYFPYWLQEIVSGFFDPMPFVDQLKQLNRNVPANPPANLTISQYVDLQIDRWNITFEPGHLDRLRRVLTKGYGVEFSDYRNFGNKTVAHKITTQQDREHGIDSVITALEPLENPDESYFAIATPTPIAKQIRNVNVTDEAFRKLVIGTMDVEWPAISQGNPKGGCAVFVSADRSGNVREGFYGGCDSAELQEPLRLAALKWKLRQAVQNGAPVQVTALLGIPYEVKVDSALNHTATLTEAEARKLASNVVEPVFLRGTKPGTVATVSIHIDDDGRFLESGPASEEPNDIFFAALNAVRKWKFTPYVQDGKPIDFKSTITFTAH